MANTAKSAEANEAPKKVKIMLPYVDGDDPYQVVIINGGEPVYIKRGEVVEVDPPVAQVLENNMKGKMKASAFQRKYSL